MATCGTPGDHVQFTDPPTFNEIFLVHTFFNGEKSDIEHFFLVYIVFLLDSAFFSEKFLNRIILLKSDLLSFF